MINYKLARKLKDSGFEQLNHMIEWELDKQVLHGVGYHLTADEPNIVTDNGVLINKARYTSIFRKDWVLSKEGLYATVYIPTLHELIKMCGDEFMSLEYGRSGWFAVALPTNMISGKTPEEAVANLWLELNK